MTPYRLRIGLVYGTEQVSRPTVFISHFQLNEFEDYVFRLSFSEL